MFPKTRKFGEMDHSHLLLISSELVSAPMELPFANSLAITNVETQALSLWRQLQLFWCRTPAPKKFATWGLRALLNAANKGTKDPYSSFNANGASRIDWHLPNVETQALSFWRYLQLFWGRTSAPKIFAKVSGTFDKYQAQTKLLVQKEPVTVRSGQNDPILAYKEYPPQFWRHL